jgi:hypothetical protein
MLSDRAKVVLAEIVFQHPTHLVEVTIVSDFGHSISGRNTRLTGIQFPRVKVHHEWLLLLAVPALDDSFENPMW